MSRQVQEFIEALNEQDLARRTAGTSALQSLINEKDKLQMVCARVDFWLKHSTHADDDLHEALRLMRAAEKLMEESLKSKREPGW